MAELPDDLPVVERNVVRLVVLDARADALLFHTHDPTYPELGSWWELPGGGMEDGETYLDTAIRELYEETGITARPEQVGSPTWRRKATFRYRGERRMQHEHVLMVRLDVSSPPVEGAQRVGSEDEDYFGFQWWSIRRIVASGERFYPGQLPALLPVFLAGEEIKEPWRFGPDSGSAPVEPSRAGGARAATAPDAGTSLPGYWPDHLAGGGRLCSSQPLGWVTPRSG